MQIGTFVMHAGTIVVASVIGFGAGITALAMGMSAWIALLIYSSAGILTVVAILSVAVINCRVVRKAREMRDRKFDVQGKPEAP